MAEGEKLGTVTPLDSLFTSEEAEKAARQVAEVIADRQKELEHLNDFIADNTLLIHHVRKLPEELSHDIMVPFGSAAFFPGRLVHTNEFMVLLGEGYYAERSSKQTVEILQRRGESLEVHLQSLKRTIKDLDAEAKFFESTAAEVVEGLVEIREEYVEGSQSKEPEKGLSSRNIVSPSKIHNLVVPDEKKEDAKIMTRLYELEKEEEEAASDFGRDEDDEFPNSSDVDVDQEVRDDDEDGDEEEYKDEDEEEDEDADEQEEEDDDADEQEEEDDECVDVNSNAKSISETAEMVSGSKIQFSYGGPNNPPAPLETEVNLQKSLPNIQSSERIPSQTPKIGSTESKAFTGTVIEHRRGLLSSSSTSNMTSAQPSRPVSRFKMQRGNR